MNRLALKTEVTRRTGDTAYSIAALTDLDAWVNQAIRELWFFASWPWKYVTATKATTAHSDTVSLDTDTELVIKVRNTTSSTLLRKRVLSSLLEDYLPGATEAAPLYYSDQVYTVGATGGLTRKLRLFPTPDAIYSLTIDYQRAAPQLTADTDEPPYPPDFDEALLSWVLVRYYRKLDDTDQVGFWQQTLSGELAGLLKSFVG